MEENLFFVGVKDPVEVRKELLHSSKNLLNSLRRYESFIQVKEEKAQVENELQRVFDELLILNKKLRNQLPKIPVKGAEEAPRKEEPQKAPVPKGKFDILEQELARVEKRLNSLE